MSDQELLPVAIERRLRAYADTGAIDFDPFELARRAVVERRSPGWSRRWFGRSARVAWIVLAIAALLGIVGLVAASLARPPVDRPLVFATRLGGLYLATADGTNRTTIADDGRYADPRWSPDGSLIAVIHGHPARLLDLPDEELLVMDRTGRIVGELPGPIRGYTWLVSDHGLMVAALLGGGRISLMDAHGATAGSIAPSVFPAPPDAIARPPSSGSRSANLIVSSAGRLWGLALEGASRATPFALSAAGPGLITSAQVGPDGSAVTFVRADCQTTCRGDLYVSTLGPSARPRLLATGTAAGLTPTWRSNGLSVLAWPLYYPVSGAQPTSVPNAAALRDLDVGAWWTRSAPDGSSVLFFRQYPGYNDRRWELWLVPGREGAAPHRLAKDITGADELPGSSSNMP